MSHRKFEAPRHGSLAFLPRKRANRALGKIKAFPKDDASEEPHFTAFVGWKAGMTHVLRKVDGRAGSPLQNKEVINPVTLLDTPNMVVAGMVGYKETPFGKRSTVCVWADKMGQEFRRCLYKNWSTSKKKAFTSKARTGNLEANREVALAELRASKSDSIRAICYGKSCPVKGRKKTWIKEIQVNGGDVNAKIDFILGLFEKEVSIDQVFAKDDNCDAIAVTKGHGTEGVITRWGVTRLPRKTHRGLRKVACIGSWHPARVSYSVARVGQNGYHHRTEVNKKIFHIGEKGQIQCATGDTTLKSINPMGGWPHYGNIKDKYVMLKGSCPGCKKRPVTLRKSLRKLYKPRHLEPIELKFVDTSSKMGHGRFQTFDDKARFMGPTKKSLKQAAK